MFHIKISIVIPIYNAGKFLDKCIGSVLNQSYRELEVILVDDGSSDNSGEICDAFQKSDDRIKVIHKKNAGVAAARNSGLKIASGDFIVFADGDDLLPECAIDTLVDVYKKSGADVVIGRADRIREDGSKIGDVETFLCEPGVYEDIEYAVCHSGVSVWAKLIKRELLYGVEFTPGIEYEDFATMPGVLSKAKKIHFCDELVYFYMLNEGSIIQSRANNAQVNPDIYKAFDVLTESNVTDLALETLYIRYILSSAGWKAIEYGDKAQKNIKDLVSQTLQRFPNIAKNPYINLCGSLNSVFVKLILKRHFTLAKLWVYSITKLKKLYKQVRKICR